VVEQAGINWNMIIPDDSNSRNMHHMHQDLYYRFILNEEKKPVHKNILTNTKINCQYLKIP
jgi:hypothetical protein